MTRSTLRATACLVAMSILLSCGDDSTAPEPPVESNVSVESGNAVSQSIGTEGGSLQTTANDGTVYTLDIPEGSIPTAETITMTPIVDIEGYPMADGVAAGVDLKPTGLVFTVPAILTIETTKTPGAGTSPVAVTYEGDATSFAPGFVGTGVGTFTIPLEHFSGWTVGFATPAELTSIISNAAAAGCLFSAIPPVIGNTPAVIAVFRSCFVSEVLPTIVGATTDRELAKAISEYNMWKTDMRVAMGLPPFDDASETQQAMDALVPKLQQAIIANNDQCRLNQSFVSTAKVLFWQRQAALFGIDTVANLLDRDTVRRNLCLRVVVDSFQLPPNMQVGFPHSLDVQFGVIFDGQTASQGAPFRVTVTGNGLTIQNPTGFTDSQGKYTTVVTATQSGGLFVTAEGCLVFPGTTTPTDICEAGQGGSSGLDLTGTWDGTIQFGSLPQIPATMTLNQNQNAISGTFTQCGEPFSRDVTGTLSGNQLLDVVMVFRESTWFGNGSADEDTIVLWLTSTQGLISIQMTLGGDGCDPTTP